MLHASTIILGFTGSIGSGCSYISKFIPNIAKKYIYFKLSDIIRDELTKEGISSPNTNQLQDKGNHLRKHNRAGYLVEALFEKLNSEENKYDYIIVDGIKNAGEVKTLKQFPYFFLFSVQADFETRKKRVVGDGKPFTSLATFKKADERDRLEKDDVDGQQVKKCNYLSDFTILNNKHFKDFDPKDKNELVSDIYYKYCEPIENLKSGKPSPSSNPNNDELCMTIAYAHSKMSSCIKRKVGAIIVDTVNSRTKGLNPRNVATDIPIVISSGYNEVPIGSEKCIYKEGVGKCYRDHLQEKHAKKFLFCPHCSNKLEIKTYYPYCDKEYNNEVYGGAGVRAAGQSYFWFLQLFRGAGGQLFDPETMKPTINSDIGVKTMEQLVKALEFGPPGMDNYNVGELWSAFVSGKIAMQFSWPPSGRFAEASSGLANYPTWLPPTTVAGKIKYALLPGAFEGEGPPAAGMMGNGFWVLSADSKNKEAAFAFMMWMNAEEMALATSLYASSLMDPYRISQFESPQYQAAWPNAPMYLDTLREAGKYALVPTKILGGTEYDNIVDVALTSVMGGMDIKAALDEAALKMDEVTNRLGRDRVKAI